MSQVKCDFCGRLVEESEAERSVSFVGIIGVRNEEIEKKIEHHYCSKQHKALYLYRVHLAFYRTREGALEHLITEHGLTNIRELVKAFEKGDPLPDIEEMKVEWG